MLISFAFASGRGVQPNLDKAVRFGRNSDLKSYQEVKAGACLVLICVNVAVRYLKSHG